MTLLVIALVLAAAVVTGTVLADSGLRLWSAFGVQAAQRRAMLAGAVLPVARAPHAARATAIRVSYARSAALRAAA